MSNNVVFRFFYGAGFVRTNQHGVDLSEFNFMDEVLQNPETVPVTQLKDWLCVRLGLPPTHTVGVHALWTKSRQTPNFYLRPIEAQQKWVKFVQACQKREVNPSLLVLPVVKEVGYDHDHSSQTGHAGGSYDHGQSSQTGHAGGSYDHGQSSQGQEGGGGYESGHSSYAHTGGDGYVSEDGGEGLGEDIFSGEADEDEIYDGLLQHQMEAEDSEGNSDTADDSGESDQEEIGQPIPASWNNDNTTAMTVNDGHDSAWHYHANSISLGALYPSKRHLQEAIVEWSMSMQRVMKTKVSSQQYLTLVCEEAGCPARVHAHVPRYDTNWKVTDVVMHTCTLESVLQDHRNLTSTLLARLLYTEIVEGKAMGVNAIIHKVSVRFRYNISYGKAWRTKQRALEARFGSFRDGYDCVVRMLQTLQARNPGTYVDIQHFTLPQEPNLRVLHRVFFSFSICIEAFTHC